MKNENITLQVLLEVNHFGEVGVTFIPTSESPKLKVLEAEWPTVRTELENHILPQIDTQQAKAVLESDRFGERLAYELGTVRISTDGDIVSEKYRTSIPDTAY